MPSMGRGKSVWFLRETEGGEQEEEEEEDQEEDEERIRRPEQTKKEGLVKQHGGWTMSDSSLFAVNREKRVS